MLCLGLRQLYRMKLEEKKNDDKEKIESNYVASEELSSCSTTNKDELDPARPRYVEFN